MISYRLRGLVHLHVAATTIAATGYFLVIALGARYLPRIDLNPDVNLILYAAPIFVGMILSGRFWTPLAPRFHTISWFDAVAVASRQILVVALLIFGLIVATKDRSVSRLFLAFYLVSCWLLLVVVNRQIPAYLARLAFNTAHRIPTLFVGAPGALGRLGSWIKQKEHLGVRIVGILTDEPVGATATPFVMRVGEVKDLPNLIEERGIGQVILLGLPRHADETLAIIETCQRAG